MSRYSAGVRTGVGTATFPFFSIYAIANVKGTIREIGAFNTTAVATNIALRRLDSAGTQGAAQTKTKHDPDSVAASMTVHTTHTAAPTLGDDVGYRKALGAAIGDGVIWTFGDVGLIIPPGVANGVGIVLPTGTGQILDCYVVWDE